MIVSSVAFDGIVFDLDGVLTRTAAVHAQAWKRLFDEYLAARARAKGKPFRPFDVQSDYLTYVDGKPRYDGVRDFLASRRISLPFGSPDDTPDVATVCGLGNRKNRYFNEHLAAHGVDRFETSVAFLQASRRLGLKTAVVSASENCRGVVQAAGLDGLFDATVDGLVAAEEKLAGKPAPDTFLAAAKRLDLPAQRLVAIEDAQSGVAAGRAGGFGLVVGVNRSNQADALRQAGADVVVDDLKDLEARAALPLASDDRAGIDNWLTAHRPALFIDYDGTLTPIVDRPDLAILDDAMRATVAALAKVCPVAIISGRDLDNVRSMVGLDGLTYAGSHGFDIEGPALRKISGAEWQPRIDQAEQRLRPIVDAVPGALLERKGFAVAVHYRLAPEAKIAHLEAAVDDAVNALPGLRKREGKKVFEVQPDIEWDKGRAVLSVMEAMAIDGNNWLPIYIGDDRTDEDAFRALRGRGMGLLVAEGPVERTDAHYALASPGAVRRFLNDIIVHCGGSRR